MTVVVKRSGVPNPKIVVQQGSPGEASIIIRKGGATGISGATVNGVAYATSSTSLGYATGSLGEVLQINASGVPVFGDVDAGEY